MRIDRIVSYRNYPSEPQFFYFWNSWNGFVDESTNEPLGDGSLEDAIGFWEAFGFPEMSCYVAETIQRFSVEVKIPKRKLWGLLELLERKRLATR